MNEQFLSYLFLLLVISNQSVFLPKSLSGKYAKSSVYRDDIIRYKRAELDLTIEQLAEISSLNKNTVSNICNGKNSVEISSLKKIADSLGLPMKLLFEPIVS